jgi:hypothetical protein
VPMPRAAARDAPGSSTTTLAPSDRTKFASVWEAVAITLTPDAVASWMARAPISEAPLTMRIVCSSPASPSRVPDEHARGRGKFR